MVWRYQNQFPIVKIIIFNVFLAYYVKFPSAFWKKISYFNDSKMHISCNFTSQEMICFSARQQL